MILGSSSEYVSHTHQYGKLIKITLSEFPLKKCKWSEITLPAALNFYVSSSSGGTTHNACAHTLNHTCAHTYTLKHAPLVPTLKPCSQARGAESSSQSAGSLGEEIIRICVSEITGYKLDGQSLIPGRHKERSLFISYVQNGSEAYPQPPVQWELL